MIGLNIAPFPNNFGFFYLPDSHMISKWTFFFFFSKCCQQRYVVLICFSYIVWTLVEDIKKIYILTLDFKGCYVDQKSRTLKDYSTSSSKMTVEKCKDTCHKKNYKYYGVEVGTVSQ